MQGIWEVTIYAYHGGERFVDTYDRIVLIRERAIDLGWSCSGIAKVRELIHFNIPE